MKTRAIYMPDIRYTEVKIFELQNDKFICIDIPEINYPIYVVISDNDWMIVSIDTDEDKIETIRV